MNKLYFEEFRRRATDTLPYAVFCRSNINYVAHIHEEIELAYIVSGKIRAATESKELLLEEGNVYVFMPDEIHAFATVTPNRVYILRILPPPGIGLDFSLIRLTENVYRPGDRGYEALSRPLLEMVREEDARTEGYELAMKKCRYEIFLAILRDLDYVSIPADEKKRLTGRTATLRRVNDYISEHYAQSISLDRIAKDFGYSKYYFAHCIKEITGVSFLEFLMLYRLNAARERIRDTDDSITEIALCCGFNSLRSFHRMFRKYYHNTPTGYRRYLQEEARSAEFLR